VFNSIVLGNIGRTWKHFLRRFKGVTNIDTFFKETEFFVFSGSDANLTLRTGGRHFISVAIARFGRLVRQDCAYSSENGNPCILILDSLAGDVSQYAKLIEKVRELVCLLYATRHMERNKGGDLLNRTDEEIDELIDRNSVFFDEKQFPVVIISKYTQKNGHECLYAALRIMNETFCNAANGLPKTTDYDINDNLASEFQRITGGISVLHVNSFKTILQIKAAQYVRSAINSKLVGVDRLADTCLNELSRAEVPCVYGLIEESKFALESASLGTMPNTGIKRAADDKQQMQEKKQKPQALDAGSSASSSCPIDPSGSFYHLLFICTCT